MKRVIAVFVVFLLMAVFAFISIHGRSLPMADFTYAIGFAIKTLDPARAQWTDEIRLAQGLWEGLTSYHPETSTPIPGVAKLPPMISPDGLTYTFELRTDAKWSNGDPVTADDFVYAWRRAIEPGTSRVYAFLITDNIAGAKAYSDWRNQAVHTLMILRNLAENSPITREDEQFIKSLNLLGSNRGKPDWSEIARQFRRRHLEQMEQEFDKVAVKAIDEHHLQVSLVRPTTYFLDLTAFTTFMPVHRESIEKLRIKNDPALTCLTMWAYDPQWTKPDYHRNGYPGLVSNGAFTLAQWQFKRYMLMKKNPCYWDRQNVKSDSIMVRIITEPSTAFLAYERGDLDWIKDLTPLNFAPALLEQMRLGVRRDIHLSPAFGTYYYYFNCSDRLADGSPNPFADARVRMAFNLAVDKQAIADKVKKISTPPARNFVPPASIEGYYCRPGPDYNPSKARQILAEAGYHDAHPLPSVEILFNTDGGHENITEAIAQMWKKHLNVNVILKGKEVKTFDEDRTNHRFMVCRGSWYGDYADPTTFLDILTTGNGQNDAAFSHPEYDQLMHRAATCANAEKRLQFLAQAEEMLLHEQVPILPIYYYVNMMAHKDRIKGIYLNPRDLHPFKYIYVQK